MSLATSTAPSTATTGSQRPLRLRRVNHSDEVVSGFGRLLKSEAMSDVTLICAGGQSIRAHKVILSMFSPYFRSIFEAQPFANNPNHYPVIVMKDLGLSELRTIVEFIYKGEASVPRDKLNAILQAAKALEVSGLSDLKDCSQAASASSPSSSESNPSPSSPANCTTITSSANFGPISGALSGVGALGGNTLSVTGSGYKRGQEVEATTIFGGTGPDPQLKKLRITLDNGGDLSNSMDISTGFSFPAGGGVVINDNGIDGVRSLLQQPPRLPPSFQQMRQQQQLQQFQQQMQIQKQQRQLSSLQQYMQQRQMQQRQHMQQRQMHLQQQVKEQILQQQLMQKGSSRHLSSQVKGSQSPNLVQFQQRIRAQLQDKQPRITFTQTSSTLQERLLQKPVSQKLKALQELKAKADGETIKKEIVKEDDKDQKDHSGDDQRKDGGDKERTKESPEKSNGSDDKQENGESKETDALNSALKKENAKSTSKDEESIETLNENEDDKEQSNMDPEGSNSSRTGSGSGSVVAGNYSAEKTCDDIEEQDADQQNVAAGGEEGRQQQLRLQQLQKQQQYQQQVQLQLQQEEQEQRLIEFHQQLQQANEANAGSDDVDDNGSGFGFDWQEGFIDDGFTQPAEVPEPAPVVIQPPPPQAPQTTPDFLQPRGPGRPRKGNKSTEISPCPECNKVFVRPDVLKLHYRSVHLNERHPCNMCPKIFKWPGDLSKHKRTKHPDA
ncbi:B-cell CLL/lymphoma 6 member B protein-like protein [Dinothrombium tinctorium]|uniref:B-cell CLL/lymphoma 6 member B protein-like protein n=1 Tax=Dinothrombium tinctorium TaxID=1965070 RepID=A0A443QW61_9ACAR|nr:B-cell CLL/lymphoma 6 member B protein-like protein [Dinothrombium tinctorium]